MPNRIVKVIGDDDLPPDQSFAVVRTATQTVIFVKLSCMSGRTLANIWASCQYLAENHDGHGRPNLSLVS